MDCSKRHRAFCTLFYNPAIGCKNQHYFEHKIKIFVTKITSDDIGTGSIKIRPHQAFSVW